MCSLTRVWIITIGLNGEQCPILTPDNPGFRILTSGWCLKMFHLLHPKFNCRSSNRLNVLHCRKTSSSVHLQLFEGSRHVCFKFLPLQKHYAARQMKRAWPNYCLTTQVVGYSKVCTRFSYLFFTLKRSAESFFCFWWGSLRQSLQGDVPGSLFFQVGYSTMNCLRIEAKITHLYVVT